MISRVAAFAAVLACPALAAHACGGDVACAVDGGNYRIAMPGGGKAKGAYVYFHGYKSSADLQMGQRALVEAAHAHGLAFVAVDGLNGTWSHPNAPARDRDEKAFVGHVLDDLHERFGFDAGNILLGGFSQGASMAWYTACQQGQRVAGMITFSGVFWNPLPEPQDCVADLPPIVHFHGTADRTFPLEGRAIGTDHHQGDTYQSFAILRERAGCKAKDAAPVIVDGIACEGAPGCVRGESLLCIHDQGHRANADDLDAALTRLGF